MKKKGIGKRILSALLALSMTASILPAGSLAASADVAVDKSTTSSNVATVQDYAATLVTQNNSKTNYGTEKFSWDSTSNSNNWTYYNGMMLDAYTMLGSELNNDSYYDFVKKVYDNGNINSDGIPTTYNDGVLGSVPMGLALFDLMKVYNQETTTEPTESDIAALQATPFKVTASYDQTQIAGSLGLEQIPGAQVVQVYKPSDDANTTDDTFVNGVVMTEFNGKLYCQWQSSDLIEDSKDTWVAYSVSSDNGATWSATPMSIATPADFSAIGKTGFCSSGGWHVYDADGNGTDDTIVAYINFWPTDSSGNKIGGGYTYYRTSTDGNNWSKLSQVLMNDGNPLTGIFEQDPHILESGRIVNAAHFQTDTTAQTGIWANPIYTDDKSGVTGWVKADYTNMTESWTETKSSREIEPSLYVNEDGNLVMIFRDQNTNYKVLAAVSTDDGETWSDAKQVNLLDARQKQSAGNLPDGTAYIVNCPVNSTEKANRFPLTITLSKDGKTFNKAYVLGLGSSSALGTIKHQAADVTTTVDGKTTTTEGASISKKRLGYHYPKSVVIGEYLYVSYAKNKEIAEYIRIPLSSISLINSADTPVANTTSLVTLTNTSSQSTEWELDYYLREGDYVYTDRKYTLASIPDSLIGSVYMRTAGDDKTDSASDTIATLTSNQDAILSVCIDQRYFKEPFNKTDDLLLEKGFEKTDLTCVASGGEEFIIYQKVVKKGAPLTFYGQETKDAIANYFAMMTAAPDTSAEKYKKTINYIYKELTSSDFTKSSNLGSNYIKSGASEITLADVYMAQRFLIECANAVNNGELVLTDNNNATVSASTIYNDVYTSLKWIGNNLYDSGLYRDAYNTSSGKSSTYQAKAVGFYAMTLVDTISMLPSSMATQKAELTTILTQLFDGMINNQDAATGMWKDDITTSTTMSCEGSAMMSYALLKAFDEGIVSDKKYGEAGVKAFNGAVNNKLSVATLSDETSTDDTNASGIAPLMMASTMAEGVATTLASDGLTWVAVDVPNSSNVYDVVRSMSSSNTNGYVITRHGLGSTTSDIKKQVLCLNYENGVYSHNSDLTILSSYSETPNGDIKNYAGSLNNISNQKLWLIDSAGYVYSKYSDTDSYYLKVTETTLEDNSLVAVLSITIDKTAASIWNSKELDGQDSRSLLYTNVNGSDYYLRYTGKAYASEANCIPFVVQKDDKTGIMLWTIQTSAQYYALAGTTSYTVASGPNAISESDILEKAWVVKKDTADATSTTNVKWSDSNVSYSWDTPLDSTTPGKYTMSVYCYGTKIGEVSVIVTGEKWIEISGESYTLVKDMVVGQKYLICNWYEAITNTSNSSTLLTRVDATTVGSVSSGYAGVYDASNTNAITAEFSGIDANDLWQIDSNRRIFNSPDGSTKYYLKMNSDKTVSVTTTASEGSVWAEISEFSDGKNILLQDTSTELYLCGSDSGYVGRYADEATAGWGKTTLWSCTNEVYATLSGTKAYSVDDGTVEEFESMAKAGATVYVQERAEDGTFTSRAVDWDDSKVTCKWESNANVHTMYVYYDGVEIGTIVVTAKESLEDLNWVDLTEYDNKYNRVQSMTADSSWWYVITEVDNTINTSTATPVTSMSASYFSEDKQWYTGTNEITVLDNNDGTFTLTNVTDNNQWYFNSSNQINATVIAAGTSDTKATGFLTNYNDSSDRIKPSRFSRDGAAWLFMADSTNAKIYTQTTDDSGTVTNHYLGFDGTNFNQSTTESSLTIYQKVAQDTTKVAIDGETNYTIAAGTTYMSESYLKTKANIYLRKETADGTVTISELSWSDVTTSWDTDLNTNTNGTYNMTVKYGEDVVGTITVNVKSLADQYFPYDGWYYATALGREPDFSSANLTVTYTDGSTEVITIANGLEITGYNVNVAGNQTAQVYYNGVKYADITVYVDASPFYNVPMATNYPEYPAAGATRIDKTATNDEFSWYQTGVTKVELDVAGISVKSGVDVVLVTDISNSMGRPYKQYDSEGNPILDPVTGEHLNSTTQFGEKLDEAMDAATEFAEILMAGNNSDAATNNTMTFVTFGGFDAQNNKNSTAYYDATQTVFVFEDNLQAVKNSFGATRFSDYGKTPTVHIGKTDGTSTGGLNSGGTNYDHAFAEAKNAVEKIKTAYADANGGSYDESDRQIILMFMTDGAPTYYNNEGVDGTGDNYIWGSTVEYGYNSELYPKDDKVTTPVNWLAHASQTNAYAEELEAMVDEFYSVGFKLSEDGGVSEHCYTWEPEDFESVLANLAGVNSVGETEVEDVLIAEDAATLTAAYVDIANQLKYSGSYATVYDEIAAEYQLEMSEAVQYTDGTTLYLDENKTQTVKPVIEVKTYDLYTSEEVGKTVNGVTVTEDMIGKRKGTSTIIETVSFKKVTDASTGTTTIEAYSNLIDNETTNILTTEGTLTTIKAKNFTYTNNNGWEYFDWYVGDIANVEYAFSYYAYLEGTNETRDENGAWRINGVYNTNKTAKLDYIDMDGNHATKEFPIPNRPWGEASTTIEYYLVNEDGQPVNHAGEVVPFANRIRVDVENESTRVREIPWGTSLTINGAAYLPVGYEMHNPTANYTIDVNTENLGTLDINKDSTSDTSTVWVNQGSSTTDSEGNTVYNVAATHVAFGVLMTDTLTVKSPFNVDRIVMDYGKAIQVDVLANDNLKGTGEHADNSYSAEVVGFRQYSTDESFIKYVQSSAGSKEYNGDYGKFTIETNTAGEKVVNYQLRKMLSAVEKVFVIIKVTQVITNSDNSTSTDTFYLCQELDVIPATSVYYETDFVNTTTAQTDSGIATVANADIFTTVQAEGADNWTTLYDTNRTESTGDQVQNDGTIGVNQTYGYDSTYLDDNYLSDGSSMYVEGKGKGKTTVSFSFTGSGFDIISRTGKTQGMIRVTAYEAGTTTIAKRMSVLNRSESTWGELYQIPVISMEIGKHGSYDVVIDVYDSYTYTDPDFAYLSRDNDFYFDAVRIYDPINVTSTALVDYDSLDTMEHADYIAVTQDQLALSAYAKDGEAYEEVTEVRDILIEESGSFDVSGAFNTSGALFIERTGNTTEYYDLANYDNIGPNNEVYLAKDQAIVFKLTGLDVTNLASIDIGAKAVDGSSPTLKAVIAPSSEVIGTELGKDTSAYVISKPINSSTVQNYQLISGKTVTVNNTESTDIEQFIASDGTAYVYITNATTDTTSTYNVLSITDIKIAYKNTSELTASYQISATSDLLGFANAVMYYEPDADVYSASFADDQTRVFGNTELTVTTEGTVEELEVTDRFGKPVKSLSTYEEQLDGTRVWTVIIMVNRVGTQKYTITGYDKDGIAGESAEASVSVTYKEGGGWQDAKSIYKTLFNSRIFSIKRSSGNKLRDIDK